MLGWLPDGLDYADADHLLPGDGGAASMCLLRTRLAHLEAVIPILLNLDLWKPGERAEGLDSAGFLAQGVPGRAAGVKDVVVGRPESVREEALLEIEPDALDGVQLGRVGRQEDEGEIGWDAQASAGVPAEARGMGARRTVLASSSSISCMAAVSATGRTSATPVSRTGQTAPNRCTDSRRRSRRPRGRTPLVNQRRQTRPVWPTRLSSRNQISSGTCGRSWPWPATSAGKVFFERRLGLAIGCGVDRTGLLPRQAEAVQHLQDPVLAVEHRVKPARRRRSCHATPPATSRSARTSFLALRRIEKAAPPAPRTVAQPFHALGIVADHPITERLPIEPDPRRRLLRLSPSIPSAIRYGPRHLPAPATPPPPAAHPPPARCRRSRHLQPIATASVRQQLERRPQDNCD